MRTKIINALIVDGSGAPGFRGELLFENGKILKAASNAGGTADSVIDAGGRVVCPGFVDMHRHCDAAVFRPDFGRVELSQGITSSVAGLCGLTLVPCLQDMHEVLYSVLSTCVGKVNISPPAESFRDYMQRLSELKLPVNLGMTFGTVTTRVFVKGFDDGPFTGEEMKRAQGLIAEALSGGALGVSMGIMFAPECYGTADEFARLAAPLRGTGKPLVIHIRGEGDGMVAAVKEVLEIGRLAEVPVHISHFKSAGANNWRRAVSEAAELIERARKTQDVTVDFYPYEGSSTSIVTLIPPAFLGYDWDAAFASLGTREGVERFKAALKDDHEGWDNFVKTLGWGRIVLSALKNHPEYAGKSVAELAGDGDPDEFAARIIFEEQGQIAIIVQSMCQEDIDTIARLPYSSVISDSLYADTDWPHPRLYGSFPKIIREYVGERKILTLEEAVKKMTSMPCQRMGLKSKGMLRAGYDADFLVFDPKEFRDKATFKNPVQAATGLKYAFINGKQVWKDGAVTDRAGQVLGGTLEGKGC